MTIKEILEKKNKGELEDGYRFCYDGEEFIYDKYINRIIIDNDEDTTLEDYIGLCDEVEDYYETIPYGDEYTIEVSISEYKELLEYKYEYLKMKEKEDEGDVCNITINCPGGQLENPKPQYPNITYSKYDTTEGDVICD